MPFRRLIRRGPIWGMWAEAVEEDAAVVVAVVAVPERAAVAQGEEPEQAPLLPERWTTAKLPPEDAGLGLPVRRVCH